MMSALRGAVVRHLRVPAARTSIPNGRSMRWSRAYHIEHPDPTVEKQIRSTALDIVLNSPHLNSADKAVELIKYHPTVRTSSKAFYYRVMSCVIDLLKKDPEFDQEVVFEFRQILHIYLSDGTEDFTKEQVTSKVLLIAKTHPSVCPSKMTEEAIWDRDLGLSYDDCMDIIIGVVFEFKLTDLPEEDEAVKLKSVKLVSDYVFNHLSERLHRRDFVKRILSEEFKLKYEL